ncbi:MAG: hypothetical protein K8R21_12255, partial [Leptospira sp.]|nr:hypothetical protein [Leptospira sp.]
IYRPDLYLYDNDRVYPKTGVYGDTNSNDGMTVDPSKTTGVKNQTVLNEIAKTPGRGASEYLTRSYQEQHIVRNIFIVNIGYTLRF